ncbi:hypothetical protein [Timonella sp. A28]|uniref:hypothetical protein n=1 Tax=Timonella sp. A28 TaxID=3442640 RepID=UPI003EB6A47E
MDEKSIQEIGEQFKAELQTIEHAGFDLPASARVFSSSPKLKTSPEVARELSAELVEAQKDKEKRRADGLQILSSKIELVDAREIGDKGKSDKVVAFEYLYTREMPGVVGADAWQEMAEYELTIDTTTNVVKGLIAKDDSYYEAIQTDEVAPNSGLGSADMPSSEFSSF